MDGLEVVTAYEMWGLCLLGFGPTSVKGVRNNLLVSWLLILKNPLILSFLYVALSALSFKAQAAAERQTEDLLWYYITIIFELKNGDELWKDARVHKVPGLGLLRHGPMTIKRLELQNY